ncbi:MAG: glycosyltransferase family 39 protein [Candidatus Curtissbacteria bacterium]|nr:glycosyltransferase family 39 protein [Candidatus Curtissbacteria bacterium]
MLKRNLPIIAIVLLAAVLRLYHLNKVPPSLNWDEIANGYNAYSILKTGKDEFGSKLPLAFRSYDDYKNPLYIYAVVPSITVFGLNDFSVRLPSVIIGTLTILTTYLMTKELFKNKNIALFSALFLAVSPWHLQLSRVAFDTNAAILWFTLGIWAFIKGTKSQSKKTLAWFSITSLAFGLNLFTYHTARVYVPPFSLFLIFLYRKELQNIKKYLILPAIIAATFAICLLPLIFSTAGQQRYQGTTIFGDKSLHFKSAELIAQDEKNGQKFTGRVLHNRRFVYIPKLIENYLSHFSSNFLFFDADLEIHHAPEIGLLYLWDLPFIVAGAYFLIRGNFDQKTKLLLIFWFLTAPIASAITWEAPHARRSEMFLPVYQILAAIGVLTLISYTKRKTLLTTLIFSALFLNVAFYLHQYHKHLPLEFAKSWLYGRKEAVMFTETNKQNYEKVIVSTKLEQPHEFWLYYSKYDPQKYLEEGGTISGGFLETRNKFDKYYFKPIEYEKQKQEAKTLFVTLPSELPSNTTLLKVIKYPNGEDAIYIFN